MERKKMESDRKMEILALCPPTEEQWGRVYQFTHKLNSFHWHHYLLMSKLPYVNAVVCAMENGDYIGVVAFVELPGNNVTFVCSYLVDAEHRGQGIGQRMWKMMMERINPTRIIALNATETMTPKYKASSGVSFIGSTFRILHGNTQKLSIAIREYNHYSINCGEYELKQIHSINKELLKFEQKVVPFDHTDFLKHFIELSIKVVALTKPDGTIIAYGATFPTFKDTEMRIGPVYAGNFDMALVIMSSLIEGDDKDFFTYVPEESIGGQKLIEFLNVQAKCRMGNRSVRSFSKPNHIVIDWSEIFALSSHFASPLV